MLTAPSHAAPPTAVSNAERAFYVELGQRIAALRRERGMTQVELAEHLGVAQQTLAHYEAGRLRLLAGALPTLAAQLEVSVEELIGTPAKRGAGKRGAAPKLQQQLEQLSRLPRAKQRFVSEMLDSVLAQAAR
ncbi:MAG TPA: helix-turn-helix domain-containing protein [Lysobacter sp.]|nr:helix-turn-helix domain-containing protein [Lysobacter sp.]